MNAKFPKLFERGQIGTLEISNRIIKASDIYPNCYRWTRY